MYNFGKEFADLSVFLLGKFRHAYPWVASHVRNDVGALPRVFYKAFQDHFEKLLLYTSFNVVLGLHQQGIGRKVMVEQLVVGARL